MIWGCWESSLGEGERQILTHTHTHTHTHCPHFGSVEVTSLRRGLGAPGDQGGGRWCLEEARAPWGGGTPCPDFLAPWINPLLAVPPAPQALPWGSAQLLILGRFWIRLRKLPSLALPADLPVYGAVSACTREHGLTWSEALSCLVLITVVVCLLRMRKLRPERRKCLPRRPEGAEPSRTRLPSPAGAPPSLLRPGIPELPSHLGLQPGCLGLAGPGRQRRGKQPRSVP